MKDLNVLKQLFLVCSLWVFSPSIVVADALNTLLSDSKSTLFDYEYKINDEKSDYLENSWVNPVVVQYNRSYSKQFTNQTIDTANFSVNIDQPIFRSGGIYFAIKYAQALRGVTATQIDAKKKEMIGRAVNLLFEMKKTKLKIKKLKLLIKNDAIDITQKQQSYDVGLLDSSFLDQAILKSNQDETQLLELELLALKMKHDFSLLSDKNPKTLKLPKLKLISKKDYTKNNIALKRDKLHVEQEAYNSKMTYAKYLPSVSIQGRYTRGDLNPLFARPGIEENYWTYGLTVSMPLDINMFSDVEASKVAVLKAKTEVLERKETLEKEYSLVQRKLHIIHKQIALAKRDEALYKRLYKRTKDLAQAGEKTKFDTKMMKHSLEVRKLDQKIYSIDKEIELLRLYIKVNSAI